ncbi:MAG: OmpA family protein [Kofleriaceae bacterium]|nr:OmpA family protein [Kofleriaceae bacterium]
MRLVSILAAAVLAAGSATAIAGPITAERAAKHDRDAAVTAAPTDVFFATGSATLAPDATKKLTSIVRWAEQHPCGTIVLDAHTDPRGGAAYNVGLSARRAEAVRDLLVSLGVKNEQIAMGLYGEAGPRRDTFAMDRRVTARVTTTPIYEIVDRSVTFGDATAVVLSRPVSIAELEGPNRPAAVATR